MNKTLASLFFLFFSCIIIHAQKLGAQSHYQKSLDYFNSNALDSAFSEINLFLYSNSENKAALALRAFYYIEMDRPEQAIEDYSHVLRIDNIDIGALTNRALLYMELERYTLALKDLDTKVDLLPNNWSAYFDRAYCLGLKGDHDKAIADFDEAIKLNPKNAASYANRGFSKINLISNEGLIRPAPEQCTEACLDLNKALALGDSTVTKMISLYCID